MKKKNVALISAAIATAATGFLAVRYTKQFVNCCKLLAAAYTMTTAEGKKAAQVFETAAEKINEVGGTVAKEAAAPSA